MSTDGLLFVIKDAALKERDLTQEEKNMFGFEEFENLIFKTTQGGKR